MVYLIHVLEDVCQAAWCFHAENDQVPQVGVRTQAMPFVKGRASPMAATMRRSATRRGPGTSPAGGH